MYASLKIAYSVDIPPLKRPKSWASLAEEGNISPAANACVSAVKNRYGKADQTGNNYVTLAFNPESMYLDDVMIRYMPHQEELE